MADGILLSGYHGNCATALALHSGSAGGKHHFYITDVRAVITCMLATFLTECHVYTDKSQLSFFRLLQTAVCNEGIVLDRTQEKL